MSELFAKIKEYEDKLNDDKSDDLSFLKEIDSLFNVFNQTFNQPKLDVRFKKIHPDAVSPSYSKDGDAGMDLTITSIYSNDDTKITYGFGISVEIPYGYVGLIFPRSSVRNYDLSLTNCVGIIDSGYRGELMSTFRKYDENAKLYSIGERGAQIIILPYPKIQFIEVDDLSETERSDGGFGSTGK